MPASPLAPPTFADRLLQAAAQLQPCLAGSARITRAALNEAMATAFGDTAANGAWSQRDSFQMLEVAVMRWAMDAPIPACADDAVAMFQALEARLPTQTVRSEEQVEQQHFSTPLALAWLVARIGDIRARRRARTQRRHRHACCLGA